MSNDILIKLVADSKNHINWHQIICLQDALLNSHEIPKKIDAAVEKSEKWLLKFCLSRLSPPTDLVHSKLLISFKFRCMRADKAVRIATCFPRGPARKQRRAPRAKKKFQKTCGFLKTERFPAIVWPVQSWPKNRGQLCPVSCFKVVWHDSDHHRHYSPRIVWPVRFWPKTEGNVAKYRIPERARVPSLENVFDGN